MTKRSKGQLHSSKLRYKMRHQNYVLKDKEGKQEVYKAVDVTDDVPTGRLRLLQNHVTSTALYTSRFPSLPSKA